MNRQRKLGFTVVLAAVAVFGGCGGDDDSPPSRPVLTTAPTPADIGTASGDLVAYVQRVIGADQAQADLAEPVDISGITLQTSDTDPPTDI